MERREKFVSKNIETIIWVVYVLVIAFLLFLPFVVSAAELEDYRHKLCAEGKLAEAGLKMLNVGKCDFSMVKRNEELIRLDKSYYVETITAGEFVSGCVPAGTCVTRIKGNLYPSHFAAKGYRDINNPIPFSSSFVEPVAPVVGGKIIERPVTGLPSKEDIEEVIKGPPKKKLLEDRPERDVSLLPSGNFWRGLSHCVGAASAGHGIKSQKKEFIWGGAVVIGVTLYYDSDKSFLDQLSWADVGTEVLCGAVSYLVSSEKKEDPPPPSSPPPSASPGPGPDPSPSPGPNPPQGNGNNNGGDGSSPGPDPVQ